MTRMSPITTTTCKRWKMKFRILTFWTIIFVISKHYNTKEMFRYMGNIFHALWSFTTYPYTHEKWRELNYKNGQFFLSSLPKVCGCNTMATSTINVIFTKKMKHEHIAIFEVLFNYSHLFRPCFLEKLFNL